MKRGFSIIELILYCGLLAIILTVTTGVFMMIVDLQLETESYSAVASDGQYILARLNYDLSQAKTVTTPALGGSSGTLAVIIDGVTYNYSMQNDNLIKNPGGQLNSFQTEVTDITFTHLGNGLGEEDTARVNLTVQSRTERRSGAEVQSFQTTIGLRPQL